MYNQRKQVVAPVKRPNSRNLEPIKTGRQEEKREQLHDRKEYQSESAAKTTSEKIMALIRQHLMIHGYTRSFETLKKQKPLISRTPISHSSVSSKYSAGKTDDLKVAIRFFQKGQRDEFFKQAFKFLDCNSDEIKKLEFELQVYFCIYSVHVMGKRMQTIEKQAVEGFKKFLEAHGSQMAQNVQYIPFFALPHNSKPQQSSIFSKIFTKEWVYKLKTKMSDVLKKSIGENGSSDSKQKENQKKSTLDELYDKHVNESEYEKKEQKELTQYKMEAEELQKELTECKSHNESLLEYVGRLSYSLEELGESSKSNLIESNKKWFIFIKELLHTVRKGSKGAIIEGLEKYEGFFGKNVEEIINNADVSIFDKASMVMDDYSINRINRTNNDIRNREAASSQIDIVKIKTVFANASNPDKQVEVCILLRALKNRLSKAKNPYSKREVVVEYTRHDICGISEKNSYIQKQLLVEASPRIREFYLRLLNQISTDIYGVQSMAKSERLILNLINILKKEKSLNEDYSRFLLGVLQKFSYPKRSRLFMIAKGIISIIFEIFRTEQETMSDSTIEFLTALIMNISLSKKSEKEFCEHKAEMLQIFSGLLFIEKDKIKNYVNGSLFLVLNFKEVMQEARRQNLESKIVQIMEQEYRGQDREEDNFYNQYEYILGKLRGEIEVNDSDENEDSESESEEAVAMDEFEEEDDLDSEDAESSASSEFIEGEEQFLTEEELLLREFTLLGPEALKEQMLTKSLLDETSRRLDNLTLSVNHSKRIDSIFNNSFKDKGSQQLQPELDKLLRQDQDLAVSPTLAKRASLR